MKLKDLLKSLYPTTDENFEEEHAEVFKGSKHAASNNHSIKASDPKKRKRRKMAKTSRRINRKMQ